MNHLLSYSEPIHPLYFFTRFVEGLCDDIGAVVLIRRPTDLDTAGSLALQQEELAKGFRRERARRQDSTASQPSSSRHQICPWRRLCLALVAWREQRIVEHWMLQGRCTTPTR